MTAAPVAGAGVSVGDPPPGVAPLSKMPPQPVANQWYPSSTVNGDGGDETAPPANSNPYGTYHPDTGTNVRQPPFQPGAAGDIDFSNKGDLTATPLTAAPQAVGQNYDPYASARQATVSPYLDQIKQDQDDITRLEAMPITNEDHENWFMSMIKAGAYGIQRAFSPEAGPVQDSGDLMARLTYGVGSMVGGAFHKKWNDALRRQKQIDQKKAGMKEKMQLADWDSKQRERNVLMNVRYDSEKRQQENAANGEYQRRFGRAMQRVKLGYKPGIDTHLDQELKDLGIEIESYDARQKPLFWAGQNKMTLDDNGNAINVTDPQGNPVIDPNRSSVTMTYNGVQFPMNPGTAFQALVGGGNTNRSIEEQNRDDENAYKVKISELEGKKTQQETTLRYANAALADLDAKIASKQVDGSNAEVQKQRQALQRDVQNADATLQGILSQIKSHPKPVKRAAAPTGVVSVKVSEDEYRTKWRAMHPQGTPEQETASIAQARADGVIK